MEIAQIKSYAWKLYEEGDDTLAFDFKGKKVIYPWLDSERGCFELTTLQAIAEYGIDNIRRLCNNLYSRSQYSDVMTPEEWADEPDVDEVIMRGYNRWYEKGVRYVQGRITGLEM